MTEQENKKYRQLVEAARDLFIRHGVKRITIEEICQKANVSKMTFYKFFRNKMDLAKTVITEIVEENVVIYDEIMAQDVSFHEKMRQLIAMKFEKSREYGEYFIQEILTSDDEVRNFILEKREEHMDITIDLFRTGQAEGAIDPDMNLEVYLYFTQMVDGFIQDETLQQILPDIYDRIDAVVKFYFYGIFPPHLKNEKQQKE